MSSFPKPCPAKIGIVGGLGAVAGADLLNRLVQLTPVTSEGDHREIVFEQRPLKETISPSEPDYSATTRKFYVYDTLAKMEKEGCNFALLPCFVSQTFLEELRAELGIEIISMIQAISDRLSTRAVQSGKVGILTTPYVRKNGLFDNVFSAGIEEVYPAPEMERLLLDAIYGPDGFKSGNRGSRITKPIETVLQTLYDQGVELVIPGLTEIPLLLEGLAIPDGMEVLDTTILYAELALKESSAIRKRAFKIGVVGGVGPAATVDFLDKIVSNTQGTRDQDHVKILIEQNPQIPDRSENLLGDGVDPMIALYSTCKKLEHGGANIISIPCNTAHAYVERIQRHLDIPIVNILTVMTDHILEAYPDFSKIGILATTGTIAVKLYQDALDQEGFIPIIPDSTYQELVMASIYGPKGVKAGFTEGLCRDQLMEAGRHLADRGAEALILGCTELPLIAPDPASFNITLLDPTLLLAQKCVSMAR